MIFNFLNKGLVCPSRNINHIINSNVNLTTLGLRVQRLILGNRCVHTPLSHPLTHILILFAHFSPFKCLQDTVNVMADDQEVICDYAIHKFSSACVLIG